MPHDKSHHPDRASEHRHAHRRDHGRSRSRSPSHRPDISHRRTRSRSQERTRGDRGRNAVAVELPFEARTLDRRDYGRLKALFALYLDVQKQLALEDLEEREARGRWKSFVGKWNRGELAEGWYDPETFVRAERSIRDTLDDELPPTPIPQPEPAKFREAVQNADQRSAAATAAAAAAADDDDDDYGPSLPTSYSRALTKPSATVPSAQDLAMRRENELEDREAALHAHRNERKDNRRREKERLDELVPKAEAGTRERQLEKKREAAASNRAFAASKTEADGTAEVRDAELMGGGDDIDDYRRRKQDNERKKSERELRREEILRAQRAERDERMKAYREKEEKTMAGLVALAKQRYG